MEEIFRSLFLWLSGSAWLRRMTTQFPVAQQIAARFVAGETAAEAMATIRDLKGAGILSTLDILGEAVTGRAKALAARDAYLELLDEMQSAGVQTDISLKLTQMGLDCSLDFCVENVCAIVKRAAELEVFVCIDMEDSPRTEKTLAVWQQLFADHKNVGVVIQAYLYRSEEDMKMLARSGATVRLCKGAYKEPASVAFPAKADVDANMARLMELMLDTALKAPENERPYLAMATHDEVLIAATKAYVEKLDFPREWFEFQMLYGIRRDLQEQLAADGYRMRVYVPFGTEWYPYYMRRMAERPANFWFVAKALFRESPELTNYLFLFVLVILLLGMRRLCRRRK